MRIQFRALLFAFCSKSYLAQVELPDLPYAQDALEPYLSEEVGSGLLEIAASGAGVGFRAGLLSHLELILMSGVIFRD